MNAAFHIPCHAIVCPADCKYPAASKRRHHDNSFDFIDVGSSYIASRQLAVSCGKLGGLMSDHVLVTSGHDRIVSNLNAQ